GRLVLMDLSAGRHAEALPAYGDGTGTPMYMAPEVLAGGAASVQSDIYGLGVLLFKLLSGGFPVVAQSLDELNLAHRTGARRPLGDATPSLPAAVVTVVERASDPDPVRRPASSAELEASLVDVLRRIVPERMPVPSRVRRAWLRRRARVLGT